MKLSTEQQKYAILKATELQLVSARKIDPSGKGKGITRLKQEANVSPESINRMYRNLLQHIGQRSIDNLLKDYQGGQQPIVKESPKIAKKTQSAPLAKPSPTVPTHSTAELTKLKTELTKSQAKITELEKQIQALDTENKELKEKVAKLTKDEPIKIEGWSLVQRKAGGGDNMYWYAGKSIGGKMHWIYLGRELDQEEARQKIEAREKMKE